MLVEVNISNCLTAGITVSQYAFLQLLWEKKSSIAMEYLKSDKTLTESIPSLIEKGYILFLANEVYHIDMKKCNDLFMLTDKDFWEFYNTFPLKVSSNGSSRPLRGSSPTGVNAIEARQKYKSKVPTKAAHMHVMACLDAELMHRKKTNSLGFMQNIITWLNQKSWQMSEYLLNDQKSEAQKHGEQLI